MSSRQMKLDFSSLFLENADLVNALETMASSGIEERGAVFTRRSVVEFILDLVGYTADKPLFSMSLLEPSFGEGDFLFPVVERLIESWKHFNEAAGNPGELLNCIRAVELHKATFSNTKTKLRRLLRRAGFPDKEVEQLCEAWLIQYDFLLVDLPKEFDFVVGNPPYVRQEKVPDILISAYRRKYHTLFDRADLYIPFIERSLYLLAQGGNLGFICSDRWTKNRYGGPLREMISTDYHLKIYVNMVDAQAFNSEVTAYPAITIISRQKAGVTRIAHCPEINGEKIQNLTNLLCATKLSNSTGIHEVERVVNGKEPWILDAPDQLAIVRRLEKCFPTLEEAGCKVGIGVATGADKAFIGPYELLNVEKARKLPLATTRDIVDGKIEWRGLGVINPFEEDGRLVDLSGYPLLKQYLEERKEKIAKRHIARKSPQKWYRTIDKIHADLTSKPKLLIPDIKGHATIAFEPGELYPHHNLYYIISDEWDLKVLQAILSSGIAHLFVSAYTTRMRGGYLRFQAQYLRRIRIPHWEDVSNKTKQMLKETIERGGTEACDEAVFQLYGLSDTERRILAKIKHKNGTESRRL